MQFLKTLFWVVLAIVLVLFARENWAPVTINLWSGLQADVKLPVLVLAAFLLGWAPMYLLYRGRIWTLRRRYQEPERVAVANQPGRPEPEPEPVPETAAPSGAPA
jgi:lipopolysaccharide assembly protein A